MFYGTCDRMFNGSVQAAQHFTTALLKNQPIILFKYTGYTTDMACEMLERADKLTKGYTYVVLLVISQ